LIELSLLLEGRETAQHIAEQHVARSGPSVLRDAARVTAALLDAERSSSPNTQEALEALPREAIAQVWFDLKWWVDPGETNARVAQAMIELSDSAFGRQSLALAMAYRGHLNDAYTLTGAGVPALFAVLARFGGVPRDTAQARFAMWLEERSTSAIIHGHRWWAQQRDTTALRLAVAHWDSLATVVQPEILPRVDHLRRSGRAYLSLARGDTTLALRQLEDLPIWPNRYYTYYEPFTRAQILARLGRDREAADLLDHVPLARQWSPTADAIVVALERGRVHDRLGNRETAIQAYSFVIDAWGTADTELQPVVTEARSALARLVGENRK
jgi:hypothetical protein